VAFRSKSLLHMQGAIDFLRHLRWGRIVTCTEDPLRRCLETISREFVRVALLLDLVSEREVRQSAAGPSLLVDEDELDDFETSSSSDSMSTTSSGSSRSRGSSFGSEGRTRLGSSAEADQSDLNASADSSNGETPVTRSVRFQDE